MTNEIQRRLAALITDSGAFRAGQDHERQRLAQLLRVRMDELHCNSIAWQECKNLLNRFIP